MVGGTSHRFGNVHVGACRFRYQKCSATGADSRRSYFCASKLAKISEDPETATRACDIHGARGVRGPFREA